MKRIINCLICFIVCLTFLSVPTSAKSDDLSLVPKNYSLVMMEGSMIGINNGELERLNCTPVEKDGNLLIPARYFFTSLGYETSYNNGICEFTKGNEKISITQNSSDITVNSSEKSLNSNCENIGGNLYVPANICDFMNLKYKYTQNKLFIVYESGEYVSKYDRNLIKLQGVYMSVDGKISSDGTPQKPISSLANALTEAKNRTLTFGTEYPIYIFVKGGEYRINDSVTLDKTVFGKSEYKGLNIVGYDGQPVFSGATEINAEEFKPVTDADTLSRLPKAGRGKVAYLDLSTQGISGLSKDDVSFPYIYVNEKQQMMSRWPNDDFAKVSSVPVSGEFCYEEENPSRWTRANDLRISGYFTADYFFNRSKTAGVDAKSKRIKTVNPHFSTHRAGSRWYACNLLEEIDVPGEWYVDRDTNILYFYPPYTLKNAKVEITTFHGKDFLQTDGVKNLTVDNIKFTKMGGRAIDGDDMENVTIKNCDFTFIQGTYTIRGERSKNITIDGNYNYNTGGGFVSVRTPNMESLDYELGNLKFTNNRIVSCDFVPSNISGAFNTGYNNNDWVGTMGAEIANNVIQDCNGSYAISYVGVDNKVHHNEIVNQAKNIHDGGAIYFGKAVSYNGSEISYNYIHHLNRENFYCGLYNDDAYAFANWHHNVIYNANRSTIIGMGYGMQYNYNLSIDMATAGTVGSRMTWYSMHDGQKVEAQRAAENSKWVEKWPVLKTAVSRDPFIASYDVTVFGNVGIGAPETTGSVDEIEKYGAKTMERNGKEIDISSLNSTKEGNPSYTYDESLFVDASSQNWTLKEDSEVAKEWPELLDIKMDEIGLSEGYERLMHVDDTFKLRYPSNGQTNVQTKEIRFSWDPLQGATQYRLVVATDPELQNVVLEKTLTENWDENAYTTDSLLNDTVYYWKVYAIGLARQDQFEQGSEGAPYAFKTAKENDLDKESLKTACDALTDLEKQIKESNVKYTDEFMADLSELVTRSADLYKNSKDQTVLDELEEEIYNFIKRSPFFVEVEFATPDFLTNPKSEWDGGIVSYNGNTVTISHPEDTRANAVVKTNTQNEVLCFQMKMDKMADGGGYQGIDYKMEENTTNSYLFIFKETVMEFQKEGKYFLEIPALNGIKEGEWVDCMLGAITVPGGVLQFVSVNGHVVFAALDQTPTRVENGGRFRVRTNALGDVHLRPMESLPETHALIEDIYNSYSNPQDETHLAVLLTGAFNAIDMDNSDFASLDKKQLATLLYSYLKDNGITISGTDYSQYKDAVSKMAVLEYYNQGKSDPLFKNNVQFKKNDVTQFEKIDQNGVNLYEFSQKQFKDSDHNTVNKATLNGECKTFDELRLRYAKNIFVHSINSCSHGWGADPTYMFEILTKANADYLGINIDDYLALNDTQKTTVHTILGSITVSMERTFDELIEDIHKAVQTAKQ